MYKSFVESTLLYASVVWGGAYKTDLEKIERIELDGMRLITGATARTSHVSLYKDTGFKPFLDKLNDSKLCLIYKIRNGLCPPYLECLLTENHSVYNFRNRPDLIVPHTRLETYKRSFIPHASSLWNSLLSNVRQANSIKEFKTLLNSNHDRCPSHFYYGKRWPAVHHARIRMGCSKLNSDLCKNLHVINSPKCECGHLSEDASHYFMHCPLHFEERGKMLSKIINITNPSLRHIMYGSADLTEKENQEIFQAVHNFISNTKRFDNWQGGKGAEARAHTHKEKEI